MPTADRSFAINDDSAERVGILAKMLHSRFRCSITHCPWYNPRPAYGTSVGTKSPTPVVLMPCSGLTAEAVQVTFTVVQVPHSGGGAGWVNEADPENVVADSEVPETEKLALL